MKRNTQQTYERYETILRAANNVATHRRTQSQLDDIRCCGEYAEPGYTDPASGLIVFGNWNNPSEYVAETREFKTLDNTMQRVAKLLEKLGAELEWSDEWSECSDCNRAVRTSSNSYGWQQSFAFVNDKLLCAECIESDPADYLEGLEGNHRHCVTFDLDLEANGYRHFAGDFENGLHPGQAADPELIAKALKAQGINRFIFRLDGCGQFDIEFSVWIHTDEFDKVNRETFEIYPTDGPSPAEALKRGLASAPVAMPR